MTHPLRQIGCFVLSNYLLFWLVEGINDFFCNVSLVFFALPLWSARHCLTYTQAISALFLLGLAMDAAVYGVPFGWSAWLQIFAYLCLLMSPRSIRIFENNPKLFILLLNLVVQIVFLAGIGFRTKTVFQLIGLSWPNLIFSQLLVVLLAKPYFSLQKRWLTPPTRLFQSQ